MGKRRVSADRGSTNPCSLEESIGQFIGIKHAILGKLLGCIASKRAEVVYGIKIDDGCYGDDLVEGVGLSKSLLLDDFTQFDIKGIEAVLSEA